MRGIDAVLVGPGGVVVLDAHAWPAVSHRDGTVFDGEDSKEGDASAVRAITDKVHDALAELGITRQSLWSVLLLAGRHHESTSQQVHLVGEHNVAAWVAARPARLEESEIQVIATILDREFPAGHPGEMLADRWPPSAAPLEVQKLTTALLRTATAPPAERWMTFLDEAQLALVTASWDGPARLTGPAGTGKTVVGLHRAAYLAERNPEPVLYVAATAAMPGVAATLVDRLTPQARDNVVCVSLRDLAVAILQQGVVHVNLDDRQAAIAFVSAWMASGRGGALSQLDERPGYWQEEIDRVVKARGITELDDYLTLERDPRRVPLDERPADRGVAGAQRVQAPVDQVEGPRPQRRARARARPGAWWRRASELQRRHRRQRRGPASRRPRAAAPARRRRAGPAPADRRRTAGVVRRLRHARRGGDHAVGACLAADRATIGAAATCCAWPRG